MVELGSENEIPQSCDTHLRKSAFEEAIMQDRHVSGASAPQSSNHRGAGDCNPWLSAVLCPLIVSKVGWEGREGGGVLPPLHRNPHV